MEFSDLLMRWTHLVAAISWIGGMIFLSFVLAPLARSRRAAPEFMALFRSAALRFRFVVWGGIAVLLGTGPLLLHRKGLSLFDAGGWPEVLRIKLGLVGLLLATTFAHDLVLGPEMRRLRSIPERAWSSWERAVFRTGVWVPRLALLLALGVLSTAIALAHT